MNSSNQCPNQKKDSRCALPNNYYKLFENVSKDNIYLLKKEFQNTVVAALSVRVEYRVNKLNGKCYVGSSISLNRRLEHYFSESYLKRVAKKMPIVNAILLSRFAHTLNVYIYLKNVMNKLQLNICV